MSFSPIYAALSPERLSTYLSLAKDKPPSLHDALTLHAWNSHVGGLLLSQLAVCEVVVRNAAADVLTAVYGPQWPWDYGFFLSLSNHCRDQLTKARTGQTRTGKVIAELSFGFWEHLFVTVHDPVLWTPHIHGAFPNLPPGLAPYQARGDIRTRLTNLRKLRNRIAHHEPLMKLPLAARVQDIETVVGYRCNATASWVMTTHNALGIFNTPPA